MFSEKLSQDKGNYMKFLKDEIHNNLKFTAGGLNLMVLEKIPQNRLEYIKFRMDEIHNNPRFTAQKKEDNIFDLVQNVSKWNDKKFQKKVYEYFGKLNEKLINILVTGSPGVDGGKVSNEIKADLVKRYFEFNEKIAVIRHDNLFAYNKYIDLWKNAYILNDNSQRLTNSLKVLDNVIMSCFAVLCKKIAEQKVEDVFMNENMSKEEEIERIFHELYDDKESDSLTKKTFRKKSYHFFTQLKDSKKTVGMANYKEVQNKVALIQDYFSEYRNPFEHGAYRTDDENTKELENNIESVEMIEDALIDMLKEDLTTFVLDQEFNIAAFEKFLKESKYYRNKTSAMK